MQRDKTVANFYFRIKRFQASTQAAFRNEYVKQQKAKMEPTETSFIEDISIKSLIKRLRDELAFGITLVQPESLA